MYTLGSQCKIFNYVLQNYLDQFLKCLADNFDNLKFQNASKVVILDH